MGNERRDKARKFLAMLERKIDNWDERSCFTVCGVKNLSRSDMDDRILYTAFHRIRIFYRTSRTTRKHLRGFEKC